MSIEISPEIAARLNNEARKPGVSIEVFLERLMNERGAAAHAVDSGSTTELPVLHLGEMGALHRRDIYEDVR